MTEKIQNKALLNIWNETACIHYPPKLGEKLPNTEVEYLRIHIAPCVQVVCQENMQNLYVS